MSIKKLLPLALLFVSFAVHSQGQVVSQAYELNLSDFSAPTTGNGIATFKRCEDCERQRARVTESTSYAVNGARVRLEDFRKAIAAVIDRDAATVLLLHHLESDTVVSIDVSL